MDDPERLLESVDQGSFATEADRAKLMSALQDMQASSAKANLRAKMDESAIMVEKGVYIDDESKLAGASESVSGLNSTLNGADVTERFNASVAAKDVAKSSLGSTH